MGCTGACALHHACSCSAEGIAARHPGGGVERILRGPHTKHRTRRLKGKPCGRASQPQTATPRAEARASARGEARPLRPAMGELVPDPAWRDEYTDDAPAD